MPLLASDLDVEACVAHALLMRLNQLAAILLAVLHNAAKCQICCVIFVFTPICCGLTMHHVHAWSRDRRSMPCTWAYHRRRLHPLWLLLLLLPQAPQRSQRQRLPSMMLLPLLLRVVSYDCGHEKKCCDDKISCWHFCFRWHFVYVINLTSFKICANNYFTTILFIGTHANIDRRLSVQVHIHVQLGKLETAVRERMLIDRQGCTAHLRLKYRYFNE